MDFDLPSQIEQCAPGMDARLVSALVRRESNFNPFAIGMDGKDTLLQQPRDMAQAVATAEKLILEGRTFSVGLAQIHVSNILAFGVTWRQSFDACTSLHYAQIVFQDFHAKAVKAGFKGDDATFAALRGYNSGNIFAIVSNAYAARIMASAATPGAPQAPQTRQVQAVQLGMNERERTAGMPEPKAGVQEPKEVESLELFDQ